MNVERTHPTLHSTAPHPQRAVDPTGWAAQTEMFWSNACWSPCFTSAWREFEAEDYRSLGAVLRLCFGSLSRVAVAIVRSPHQAAMTRRASSARAPEGAGRDG